MMDDDQIKVALDDHCTLIALSLPKGRAVHIAISVSIPTEPGHPARSLHYAANVKGRELSNLIASHLTSAIDTKKPPGQ